ncbi:hypothetical protein [Microcystis phage Mae-JY09]
MTEDRNLVTTLPPGLLKPGVADVVSTEPDPRRPWTISAQCAQAQEHRETVRYLLTSRGAARLLTERTT